MCTTITKLIRTNQQRETVTYEELIVWVHEFFGLKRFLVKKNLFGHFFGLNIFFSWKKMLVEKYFWFKIFVRWNKKKNVWVKKKFGQINIFGWKSCLGRNKILGQIFLGLQKFRVEKFFDPRSGNKWNNMEVSKSSLDLHLYCTLLCMSALLLYFVLCNELELNHHHDLKISKIQTQLS